MYFVLKILNFFLFTLFRSTCFGHHCVHHQELLSCTYSLWSLSIIRNTCSLQICHYAVTTQQDWRTQPTKHHTVCNNNIIQETNPTEPQPKTKQHKTNIEVKKRFICATQIICSNYKMYIMTYL